MRLWSIHPEYLDRAGLTACWREGLLAKKVLEGTTKGYRNHPQLLRFKEDSNPLLAINAYLHSVVDEADRRGYSFNRSKLLDVSGYNNQVIVSDGQIAYEWQHLLTKLAQRAPEQHQLYRELESPKLHPMFGVISGPIASWEKL